MFTLQLSDEVINDFWVKLLSNEIHFNNSFQVIKLFNQETLILEEYISNYLIKDLNLICVR